MTRLSALLLALLVLGCWSRPAAAQDAPLPDGALDEEPQLPLEMLLVGGERGEGLAPPVQLQAAPGAAPEPDSDVITGAIAEPAPDGGATLQAPAPVEQQRSPHRFSLTFAPLLLLSDVRVVELTGEARLGARASGAVILGAGTVQVDDLAGQQQSFTAYEVGGQLRWYALGSFTHGLQLGVELLYLQLSGDLGDVVLSGSSQGLAVGPFLGYKFVSGFGLTFDGQLGFQSAFLTAEVSDAAKSASIRGETSAILPLLNLNVGWSF